MFKIIIFFFIAVFSSCSFDYSNHFAKKENAFSISDKKSDWTVMFYVAADNNLESEAINDINALETVDFESHNINAVCLLDRSSKHDESNDNWSGTKFFEITKDIDGENRVIVSKESELPSLGLESSKETNLNMADSSILENYLRFCYKNYPAKKYALILWGHSSGWKSLFLDTSSNAVMPLSSVKYGIQNSFGTNTIQKLDILAIDSSFSSNIETVWEFRNLSDYFISNVDVGSLDGFDYKNIFSFDNTNISVIKTCNISNVQKKLNCLFSLLTNEIDSYLMQEKMRNILLYDTEAYMSTSFPTDKFLNLYDVCFQIEKNISIFSNKASILNLLQEIKKDLYDSVVLLDEDNTSIPKISIFLTTILSGNIPSPQFDTGYVQKMNRYEQIDFINDMNFWTPTDKKNLSLLDKVFLTSF